MLHATKYIPVAFRNDAFVVHTRCNSSIARAACCVFVGMSRRLRGQTTLQSLIGRSTITKKNNASQKARRSSAAESIGPSPSAPAKPISKPSSEAQTPKSLASERPIPPGHAACPVCGAIFATDLNQMNLHLGMSCHASCRSKIRATQTNSAIFLVLLA